MVFRKNVFANPAASSSASYPQELNPWSSQISERIHSSQAGKNRANIVMWVVRLNNADWDCFKTQTLQEILNTQNQHQTDFLEVEHLQEGNESVPQLHRIRDHIVGCWFVYGRFTCGLTCGIWSFKCWERRKEYQNQPKRACGNPMLRPIAHPRLNKCWIRMWICRT